MRPEKPTICVALNSEMSARSLVSSGALKDLIVQFNVIYLCSDTAIREESNCIKINFTQHRSWFVKWADYFLWYLTYFKYFRRTKGLKKGFRSFKITMLGKRGKTILTICSLPVIYDITKWFIEKFIIRYDRRIYRSLKKINPEILIVPGVPFDSFGLEAIKCARRLSIKSIMAVIHWDFFSSKGLLRENPDIVCLWGKQMYDMVSRHHKISVKKIKVIGVPQFEIYKNEINQAAARKYLNLPLDKKLFLFAGTGAPFDEMSILEEMDSLIGTRLPLDILVLYRPHPKKQPRKNEKKFKEYKFKNISLDPENANGNKRAGETNLDYYTNLLFSIDGLISPFSTMTIEAALCGKPCLAIGFSDDLHNWKFEHALNHEHIQPLLDYKWVILCQNKNKLYNALKSLLDISINPDIARKVKEDIRYIVYTTDDSYSKRLHNIVVNVMWGDRT